MLQLVKFLPNAHSPIYCQDGRCHLSTARISGEKSAFIGLASFHSHNGVNISEYNVSVHHDICMHNSGNTNKYNVDVRHKLCTHNTVNTSKSNVDICYDNCMHNNEYVGKYDINDCHVLCTCNNKLVFLLSNSPKMTSPSTQSQRCMVRQALWPKARPTDW